MSNPGHGEPVFFHRRSQSKAKSYDRRIESSSTLSELGREPSRVLKNAFNTKRPSTQQEEARNETRPWPYQTLSDLIRPIPHAERKNNEGYKRHLLPDRRVDYSRPCLLTPPSAQKETWRYLSADIEKENMYWIMSVVTLFTKVGILNCLAVMSKMAQRRPAAHLSHFAYDLYLTLRFASSFLNAIIRLLNLFFHCDKFPREVKVVRFQLI